MFSLITLMASAGTGEREGDRIALTNRSVIGSDNTGTPWVASAGFVVRSDGKLDLYTTGDGSAPTDPTDQWVDSYPNTSYASNYECQVGENSQSGAATRNGTVGSSWIDCSTSNANRDWSIVMITADADWELQVIIRHKVSLVEYAAATITLQVFDNFS